MTNSAGSRRGGLDARVGRSTQALHLEVHVTRSQLRGSLLSRAFPVGPAVAVSSHERESMDCPRPRWPRASTRIGLTCSWICPGTRSTACKNRPHWGKLEGRGGCQPAAIHSRRTITAIALLSCSAATVARPVAESPTTWRPPSLQAKCSPHFCCLGLKSGTVSPVAGSTPCVFVPLKLLQSRHESQRFSSLLLPPRARGTMCSISSGAKTYRCGARQ